MPKQSKNKTRKAGKSANQPAPSRPRKSKGSKSSTTMAPGAMMRQGRTVLPQVQKMRKADSHIQCLRSMCNPWGPEAIGCKYPDGQGVSTVALQSRWTYTASTDATGSQLVVLSPSFPYAIQALAPVSSVYTLGNAVVKEATTSLLTTLVSTNGAILRPVCGGVVLRCLQNAMQAQGNFIISKVPGGAVSGQTWAQGTLLGNSKMVPNVAGGEYPILFEPVGPTSYSFVAANSATTNTAMWDSIFIECVGCATSVPTFIVDYVVNYEVELNAKNQGYAQLATPSPPDNPLVKAAVSKAQKSVGSIFEKGVEAAGKSLFDAGVHAIEEYLPDIAALFF